jgi:hypothetical protein
MRDLLLLETVYGPFWQDLISDFRYKLNKLFKNLDLTIEIISLTDYGNIYIRFSGLDEEFAYNLLKKDYHICRNLNEIEINGNYFGKLVQVGKFGFGIFINIGAIYNDTFTDALIPLYKLREQLVNDKKISTRKIIDIFGFIDEIPLEVLIRDVDINEYKIEAEFTKNQLDVFKDWIRKENQRINIAGVLKGKIEQILNQTDHKNDIIEIQKLGLFEYSLICKAETDAPGIISSIGSKLPGIEMNAFVPDRLNKL